MRARLLFLLFIVVACPQALALPPVPGWQESPEAAEVFSAAGMQGTFVLYDVSANRLTGYNQKRAETLFVPASTYKIPNTLIGLATGAVQSVDEVLPYGGKPQPVKAWERDMGLRDAIAVSNVPVYQELARRTGLQRMQAGLAALEYGNQETGTVVDTFWLRGPLAISAVEQARFLARLALKELPLSREIQTQVKDIIRIEHTEQWGLFAKTGTAMCYTPPVGWWVGWVEKSGTVYTFALNMDMLGPDDAARRAEVGRACLRALGVI